MSRAVLVVVLGALAGCDGSAIVGLECRAGRVRCGNECVDLMNDRRHCGACDSACPSGLLCVRGACVAEGCDDGLSLCDEICADLSSDPYNCDVCGETCDENESCQEGECVPDCEAPFSDCDGSCVDLSSDPDHCGACGSTCDVGESCESGECAAPEPCGDGGSLCGDECVDLGSDTSNCGACGEECLAGEVCRGGACRLDCTPGRTDCRTGECVDLDSDPTNCGACGVTCRDAEVCSEGHCRLECGEDLVDCGRSCVDVQFDPDHCGGCGAYCDTGICELGVCQGGEIGHWVLVGHDYRQGRRDQNRVVGNAVFMAGGATVDVLVHTAASDPTEIANVYSALEQVADDLGRSFETTPYDPDASLAEALAEVVVFLVMDQEGVGGEALEATGMTWAEDLDRFLRRGGVLVVSDGGDTYRLLVGAGLVEIDSSTDVAGDLLEVTEAADAVAAGMPPMYRGERTSVAYETEAEGGVVSADEGPVVLHQVVRP